ncbi:MAG: tetratricopeptide repeat protein [Balneolia bacterium]|nr:tetratricopeptide repeat protein [Balneolia bacterium]
MNRLIVFMMLFLLAAASPDRAREANSAYERGDFAAAEQAYRDAIEANPGDARLHFNLGNTLAQLGRTEDAIEAYERFRQLARSPEERAMADYNIGNLKALEQNWEEAAEQFRRSLRQNPNDDDAANNFEYVLRQLQDQQNQQDQQDQQQDQQDSGGAGEPQQGQQDRDDDRGDGSGDAQAGEDEQDGDSGDGDQQEQGESMQDQQLPQPQPGDMSQQEAEQLLNAISGREQDLIRDFLKDLADPAEPTEKDW